MNVKEIKEFLELLAKLDTEMQKELLYMIKGAALVADRKSNLVGGER